MRLGPWTSEARGSDDQGNAPDLPPRHAPGARGADRLSSSSNFDICPGGDAHREFIYFSYPFGSMVFKSITINAFDNNIFLVCYNIP